MRWGSKAKIFSWSNMVEWLFSWTVPFDLWGFRVDLWGVHSDQESSSPVLRSNAFCGNRRSCSRRRLVLFSAQPLAGGARLVSLHRRAMQSSAELSTDRLTNGFLFSFWINEPNLPTQFIYCNIFVFIPFAKQMGCLEGCFRHN